MTSLCLLSSKLKVLGSLQNHLLLGLTLLTFETDNNLTGSLCLLVKDGLGLSSESHLLGVITTFSLIKVGSLSSLVLGDLVWPVLPALAAIGVPGLWDIHHTTVTTPHHTTPHHTTPQDTSTTPTRLAATTQHTIPQSLVDLMIFPNFQIHKKLVLEGVL